MAQNSQSVEILFRLAVESGDAKRAWDEFTKAGTAALKETGSSAEEFNKAIGNVTDQVEKARIAQEKYTTIVKDEAAKRLGQAKTELDAKLALIAKEEEAQLRKITKEEQANLRFATCTKQRLEIETQANAQKDALIEKTIALVDKETAKYEQSTATINRDTTEQIQKLNQASATLHANLTEKTEGTTKSLKGLSGEVSQLAGKAGELIGGSGLGGVPGSLIGIADAANPALAALTTLVAATIGVVAGAKSLVDIASRENESLINLSVSTGVAADTITTFRTALQLSGQDAGKADLALEHLSLKIQEAKDGNEKAQQSFARLGSSITDGSVKSAEEVLSDLADHFDSVKDSTQKAADLAELFGARLGKSMGPVLESFKAVQESAKSLGVILSEQQRTALTEYDNALDTLETVLIGIRNQLAANLAPVFTQVAEEISAAIERLNLQGDDFQKFAVEVVSDIVDFGKALISLGPSLQQIIEAVGDVSRLLLLMSGNVKAASEGTTDFKSTIHSVTELVKTLSSNLEFLTKTADKLSLILSPLKLIGKAYDDVQRQITGKTSTEKEATLVSEKLAEATKKHEQAEKEREIAVKESEKSLALLKKQLQDLEKQSQAKISLIETDSSGKTASLEEEVAKGTKSRLEIAKIRLKIAQDEAKQELEIAQKVYDASQVLVEKGELTREEVEAKFAATKRQSEQKELEATKAISEAAAEQRAEVFKKEVGALEVIGKDKLSKVQQAETAQTISHQEAERQRFEISQKRVSDEISLLQGQLTAENVSAKEKEKIEGHLDSLRNQLAQQQIEYTQKKNAAIIKDEQDRVAKITALNDLEIAKTRILIQQANERGLSEVQVGKLQEDIISKQLNSLDTLIAAKRKEAELGKADTTELIKLETQRLDLIEKQRLAHLATTGQIVDGNRRQKSSQDELNKSVVDYITVYTSQANLGIPGQIEKTTQKLQEEKQAVQNLYGAFAIYAGYVQEAAKATADNIDQITTKLQKSLADNAAIVTAFTGNTIGAWEYVNRQLTDALQAAYKRKAELEQDRVRKEQEIQQKQLQQELEAAKKSAEEIAQEREKLESNHNDAVEKLNADLLKSREQEAKDEIALQQKTDEALEKLDSDHAKKILEEASRLAEEQKKIEQELQNSLIQIKNKASLSRLKSEADTIVSEAELRKQLSVATTPEEKAKLQQQIDALEEKRRTEKRRQDEIDAALSSGKSKAEIDADLERINQKYDLEKTFQDQKIKLLQTGDTKALAELTANFENQKKLIQAQYEQEIIYLKEKQQQEQEAKDKAKVKEEADYQAQRQTILDRQKEELENLKKKLADKQAEIDSALKTETESYHTAYDALVKKTQDAFASMSEAAKKYFSDLLKGSELLKQLTPPGTPPPIGQGGPGGPGGGTGSGTTDAGTPPPTGPGSPPPGPKTPPPSGPGTPPPGIPPPQKIITEIVAQGKIAEQFNEYAKIANTLAQQGQWGEVQKVAEQILQLAQSGKGPPKLVAEIKQQGDYLLGYALSKLTPKDTGDTGGPGSPGPGFGFDKGPEEKSGDTKGPIKKGGPVFKGGEVAGTSTKEKRDTYTNTGEDPGPAQAILGRLSAGELSQEAALAQWQDQVSRYLELKPYDASVTAKIKAFKTGTPGFDATVDQTQKAFLKSAGATGAALTATPGTGGTGKAAEVQKTPGSHIVFSPQIEAKPTQKDIEEQVWVPFKRELTKAGFPVG